MNVRIGHAQVEGWDEMDLALAAQLAAAKEDPVEGPRLKAYFAAMLRGLELDHADADACRGRMEDTLVRLRSALRGAPPTWSAFYAELVRTIELDADGTFYLRNEQLDTDLDLRAVTFQCALDDALIAWMGKASTPASLAKAVRQGRTKAGANVGRPGRAAWLTPMKGTAKRVVDSARNGPSSQAAGRVRKLLAASWWKADWVIVALVTKRPLREIQFEAADKGGVLQVIGPVGPTILEARDHKHFRHWPHPSVPLDRYGRTYHFDPLARRRVQPALNFGVQEVVLKPIPLSEFDDCVVIGRLTASDCTVKEPDTDFLGAVDGTASTHDLFAKLMASL